MVQFRIYADGTVVPESSFSEYDKDWPIHDDYLTYKLDEDTNKIPYWDLPNPLVDYIFSHCEM